MGQCQSEVAEDTAELLGAYLRADDVQNFLATVEDASLTVASRLEGRPLLHVAAGAGSLDCTRGLLALGAKVNQTLDNNDTPLHLAAGRKRFVHFFRELPRVGPKQRYVPKASRSRPASLPARDSAGAEGAVQEVTWDADVIRGDVCKLLLESGADIRALDMHGRTALHVAAEEGQVAATLALIERCPDLLPLTDKSGATPLFLASRAGHWAVVICHLLHGCDVDAVRKTEGPLVTRETALHAALTFNRQHVVTLLCSEGADVNLPMPGGRSPLHHAVRFACPVVVCSLLEAGADVDARDQNEATPLFYALRTGELQVVDRLRRQATVSASGRLSMPEERGVIMRHALQGVSLLLEAGAELDLCCAPDVTTLKCCLTHHMAPVAILLLQHGAAVGADDATGVCLDVLVKQASEMAPVLMLLTRLSHCTWSAVRLAALRLAGGKSLEELVPQGSARPSLGWLRSACVQVLSLQTLSRAAVRQAIRSDWKISLLPAVHTLPVPQNVRDYLMMQEWNAKIS